MVVVAVVVDIAEKNNALVKCINILFFLLCE